MNRKLLAVFTSLLLILGGGYLGTQIGTVHAQQGAAYSQLARVAGEFDAKNFNSWQAVAFSGFSATGSQTLTVFQGGGVQLQDGTVFYPFNVNAPLLVDAGQANAEVVTPTAISGCTTYSQTEPPPCQVTATFANTHGRGAIIKSGTLGLQEALNLAKFVGAGMITFDRVTINQGPSVVGQTGGPTSFQALVAGLVPYSGVQIADKSAGPVQYWNPVAGAAVLATPATLTAVTALPSTAPVGTFTATAYNMCISYVDIFGQEGNCSTSFVNTGAGATSSFIFSPPAASTGAVGYTIYIGLTAAGSTTLQYKVPLVTQPTVVGVYPVANGVCTLTTVETVTPACAVANTTYGQSGATATVTAITLSTSPIQPETTIASTTSVYVPNPGGRTTYTYAPGGIMGAGAIPGNWLAFPLTVAAATTVPAVLGTINLPPGFMNILGKKIEVCGEATGTATAATITDIQIQWDSMGQNTAGKGVLIGDFTDTTSSAMATTGHITFCEDFAVTTAAATATGGSINHVGGYMGAAGLTVAGSGGGGDTVTPGAIGSLNLAVDSRINIIYLHTTATDGAGWILQSASVQLK